MGPTAENSARLEQSHLNTRAAKLNLFEALQYE
jgi:hypothetical protein